MRPVTSADVTQLTAPASAKEGKAAEGGIKSTAAASPDLEALVSKSPLRLAGGRRRPAVYGRAPAVMEKVSHQLGGGGRRGAAALTGLQKQNSWSPDIERDEAWERRRGLHRRGSALRRGRSVTDDDLDELRGCIDLGFGFEAAGCAACGAGRSRLVQTFPALDLYYAVQGGGGGAEGCASPCACGASSEASEESPLGSPMSILSPGDTPETVKMRLKQWAQVVALSVRNRS